MLERRIVVGPFQCNCRILVCERTGHAALIDPGDEPEKLIREMSGIRIANGAPIQVQFLLHTHGHLDHIAGTRGLKENLAEKPSIAIHRGDEMLYRNLKMQSRLFGLSYSDPLPIDRFLEEDEVVQVGNLRISVMHTPGHSPGSICLRLHEDRESGSLESLFSGDTLFKGSVGRTDLWGGDQDLMFKNIHEKILRLDGDTRVCPGHGPDSTIGTEIHENPFLK